MSYQLKQLFGLKMTFENLTVYTDDDSVLNYQESSDL